MPDTRQATTITRLITTGPVIGLRPPAGPARNVSCKREADVWYTLAMRHPQARAWQ
jgi:hypothetical protein